jgi:hypothetical protein
MAVAEFVGDQIIDQLDEAPPAASGPIKVGSASQNFSLTAVPLPIVDPTLGTGVALVGLATFKFDPEDRSSPRSTAVLTYARTNNNNEIFGVGGQFFFDEDRFRGDFTAGVAELNLDFYGIGGFIFRNPIPFKLEGKIGRLGGAVRVIPNTFVGVRGFYADTEFSTNSNRPIRGNLALNVKLRGIGPFVEHDTRDSTWYPESGTQAKLNITRFDDVLLRRNDFNTFDSFVSHYASLRDNLVLAGNFRAAYAGEGAPFFLFPFVDLRGFPALQFMNKSVVQAEAELRWRPFRFDNTFFSEMGFVAFAGGGVATRKLSNWRDAPVAYAGGLGVRYRVSEDDRINVGIDVAWGRDNSSALYFRIGEAF